MIERWCKVQWDEQVVLTTPKGAVMKLECCQGMPYLSKSQIRNVFEDLPAANVPGRSGQPAGARVCATFVTVPPYACAIIIDNSVKLPEPQHTESRAELRKRLSYVTDVDKDEFGKWVDRYRCMPDYYYDGAACNGPTALKDHKAMQSLGLSKGQPSAIWELCAGAGKLSASTCVWPKN